MSTVIRLQITSLLTAIYNNAAKQANGMIASSMLRNPHLTSKPIKQRTASANKASLKQSKSSQKRKRERSKPAPKTKA